MAPLDAAPKIALPPLPYDENALEPTISARTLSFHHGKHHKAYVEKTNELLTKSPLAGHALEEIVRAAARDPKQKTLFDNAAQSWNHNFYWNGLTPRGSNPRGALKQAIDTAFGDLDELKAKLVDDGVKQFGSGWVWLVVQNRKLKVIGSADADTPIAHGLTPLLTLDVWEHAYYLDYQNQREAHLKAVMGKLVNWEFASRNFEQAMG